jgi:hypothetical protein
MKHRYIFCNFWGDYKISSFRLFSNAKRSGGALVRVNIPDDLQLRKSDNYEKSIYERYSITDDERTIDELGYDCYIFFNGQWRKFNWLKRLDPYYWIYALKYIFGLKNCYDTIGWTDNFEYYKEWLNKERIPALDGGGRKYPNFKEDKEELFLEVNLVDESIIRPFRIKWLDIYDEFKNELGDIRRKDKSIWCGVEKYKQ